MKLNSTFLLKFPGLFFSLIAFTLPACLGQTSSFILPATATEIPENPEIESFRTRLRKNPNLSEYYFVKLNPLAQSQKDGFITLNIPNKEMPVIAEASQVKYHSETDYEWIGKTDEDRGTVIILSKEGRVCAHISTPDGVYEIFPAPGNLYCLQIIDMEKAGDVGCATTGERRNGGKMIANEEHAYFENDPQAPANAKMNPCQPLVNPRVLVLYTPNALALAGGSVATITDQANLSVAQFNSSIYNSGISSGAVLTLAGVAPLNLIETPNNLTKDVTDLTMNLTAQNLRNQFQADIVVLYTNGPYGARGGTATPFFNSSTAYSIVQILNSVTNKTFAHEVGHIYGCRHDAENGNPQYAQGHNIKNGLGIIVDRTMMSTHTDDGSNRLLNFSNPAINAGGKPTGTNSDNNNAKRITETHLGVGGFRPNPIPPLAGYINGPTYVTTPGGKNYELDYNCGSAPYSFVWQYSYDGVNYTTSNIASDVFTWNFYQNQKVYLKGTVKANGSSTTAFIAITAQMPSPYKVSSSNVEDTVVSESANFNIDPNPSSEEFSISYNLDEDAFVKLELLDQTGKLISLLIDDTSKRSRGSHKLMWNCSAVQPGIYFAKLSDDKNIRVKRVFVVK